MKAKMKTLHRSSNDYSTITAQVFPKLIGSDQHRKTYERKKNAWVFTIIFKNIRSLGVCINRCNNWNTSKIFWGEVSIGNFLSIQYFRIFGIRFFANLGWPFVLEYCILVVLDINEMQYSKKLVVAVRHFYFFFYRKGK